MDEQNLFTATSHSNDMPLHPCIPQSHPVEYVGVHSQVCEQESCATTAATGGDLDLEDLDDSQALSGYNMHMQCHQEVDADLDLSLGYGNHPGFISSGASETIDLSRSNASTVLDEHSIDGRIAATDHPLTSSNWAENKSSEDKDWENMPCSRASNLRLSSLFVDTSCRSYTSNGAFTTSLQYDGKVFFCKFCDRQFHSSQALGGHQNAHKRERLVARSTPRLLFRPFYRSPQLLASPTDNGRQPLGHPLSPSHMVGDASKGFPPTAVGHSEMRKTPMVNVPSMCTDAFKAPHHASSTYKAGSGCHNMMCGGNAYIIGNRSLGIKVHSLVHKPPTAQALHMAPQMGNLKGQMVSIVGRGAVGMARRFATGLDCLGQPNLQTAARFEGGIFTPSPSRLVCRREEAGALLRRRRAHVTRLPSPLPACSSQLDSSVASTSVDLALHL